MGKQLLALTVACAGLGLCLTASAAYLDEEEGRRPPEPVPVRPLPPRPIEPPRHIPPPPPVADNPLTEAVRRISVGEPYSHGGLTVFPLEMPRVEDSTDYLSLDEALRRDTLIVMEKGRGSVPVVLAENTGRRPVLLLGGEIVVGGKQNRTLQEDVLLLPRSGRVELPVLCVERGRWSGHTETFEKRSSVAALEVRVLAQSGAPQEEVWVGVGRYRADIGASSPGEDLQTLQDSREVQEAVKEYREAFRDHWRPEMVGMVVARYGRVVGADIFCNADVFLKHRERILDSYSVDCYAQGRRRGREHERLPVPGRWEAERFLERTLGAHYGWRESPGAGRLLSVNGPGISGSALIHEGALVHASIFARDEVIILPAPVRPGRPVPRSPERPPYGRHE